jgi:hypothetical protein
VVGAWGADGEPGSAEEPDNPERVVALSGLGASGEGTTLSGLNARSEGGPRVARRPASAALRRGESQPWALRRNPFGILRSRPG